MGDQLQPSGPPPSGPPPSGQLPSGPPSGPPPSGPPSGPSAAAAPPAPGAPRAGFHPTRNQWLALAGVVVLLLGIGGGLLIAGGGGDEKSEVFLEPVNSATHAFTEPAGTDVSAMPATTTTTPPTTSAQAGIPVVSGATAGLYGGSLNQASCDPEKLVTFLEQNPDKAAAWAGVVGIRPSDIRSYVATLTPVILRSDTRVTNHGWQNGRAVPIPAVLQAGTAVLVDRYGQPVAKCYCGNPLSPPSPVSSPTYTGKPWPQFSPTTITVINQSTTVVNVFVVVDVQTGQEFGRPAGTTGASDGPAPTDTTPSTTTPSTTTTAPRSTTTTTRPPGKLVDGTYTIALVPGTYAGCGEVTNGEQVQMTVQGDTLTINGADGVTYTGSVERTGGTFRWEGSEGGVSAVLDGRIDNTGYVTATFTVTGAGETCSIPVTGQRN